VETLIDRPFSNNGDFVPTKPTPYYQAGQVWFGARAPGWTKGTKGYRTVFGPCVPHNGIIQATTGLCFGMGALKRMTSLRFPLEPGMDLLYYNAQRSYLHTRRAVITRLQRLYEPHFDEFLSAYDARKDKFRDPHPKKALRVQCMDELTLAGDLEKQITNKSVTYKVKSDEWAKPGKWARGIGDLGVAASLQGAWITEALKTAQYLSH
jgi:hypothetical protein